MARERRLDATSRAARPRTAVRKAGRILFVVLRDLPLVIGVLLVVLGVFMLIAQLIAPPLGNC